MEEYLQCEPEDALQEASDPREITSVSSSPVRILVAEDSQPFRQFISWTMQSRPFWKIICEVSDGRQAVHKAVELQPQLILLDIGLPSLNGIEAASQICSLVPAAKILFVSMNRDAEVVRAALNNSGAGYLLKQDAGAELVPAIEAVLQGKQYVSSGLDHSIQLRP